MTDKRASRKAEWRRFVERRCRELHDTYPCAAPTRRHVCPKHHRPVPQEKVARLCDPWTGDLYTKRISLSGICKPCREELYDQLVSEYAAFTETAVLRTA